MLIDINFLEHKTKQSSKVMPIILLLACCVAVISFLYLYHAKQVAQLQTLQQRLSEKKQIIAASTGIAETKEEKAFTELQAAASMIAAEPIKETSFLLNQLSGLLPESGVVTSFTWSNSSTFQANVSFVSSRQAAYYLADMEKKTYFTDVTLDSVDTEQRVTNTNFQLLPEYHATYTLEVDKDKLEKAANKENQ